MKKKVFKILYAIFNIIFIFSSIYIIFNVNLLMGIEDLLRYIFIFLVIVFNLFLIYRMFLIFIKKRKKKLLPFIIILFIISGIFIFIGYNINKVYTTINNLSKNTVTYSSSLVVLSDSKFKNSSDLSGQNIGVISKEINEKEFELSEEIIDNEKINANLVIYENAILMLNDLLNGKINAIFINSNYIDMYSNVSLDFENINTKTTILTSTEKKVDKEDQAGNIDVLNKPFTILVIGVDSTNANIHVNNAFNGDSLTLITFDPKTLSATMLSIPRDTYVPITCFAGDKENKITHAAWYGETCMMDTITNFTGIEIDYYVKINFKGVVNLVDALGGIEVDVPIEFCEQNSDRQFGDSLICLSPGLQTLNGEEALALARHRKTINDIQRGLNQQLVINGIVNSSAKINSLDTVYELLDSLAINLDTNFKTEEILSFYNIGKDLVLKSLFTDNSNILTIEKLYLSGYDQMIWEDEMKLTLYNYVLYPGSLNAVIDAMKVNLGLKEKEIIKSFNYELNENYTQELIGKGNYIASNYRPTVPKLVGSSKEYVSNWAKKNGITVIFEEVISNEKEGTILNQNFPHGYFLSKIPNSTITFSVAIKEVVKEPDTDVDTGKDPDSDTVVPNMVGWSMDKLNQWKTKYSSTIRVVVKEQLAVSDEDIKKIGTVISNTKSGLAYKEVAEITIVIMVKNPSTPSVPDDNNNSTDDSNKKPDTDDKSPSDSLE